MEIYIFKCLEIFRSRINFFAFDLPPQLRHKYNTAIDYSCTFILVSYLHNLYKFFNYQSFTRAFRNNPHSAVVEKAFQLRYGGTTMYGRILCDEGREENLLHYLHLFKI